MPEVVTRDWEDGPMGPGFFLLFPRNVSFFYDGGEMTALLEEPSADKKKGMDELVALIMLMGCQQ